MPIVNAGPDQQVIKGTVIILNATVSINATTWSWQPTDHLSCANCLSPTLQISASGNYIFTAITDKGCKASDQVHIQLICKTGLVYIPSVFTPNHNGLNEFFGINGSGIKTIKHFIIYDRWGKLVFERSNINADDSNSKWDGAFKGRELSAGNYIFSVQIVCEDDDIFNYKGNALLIR